MQEDRPTDTAEALASALRLLEHSAAERGGALALPAEAEVAILRLARQAAEWIAGEASR